MNADAGTMEIWNASFVSAPMDNRSDELRALYKEHWQEVFAAAYRVTGNAADAEDVLQTVFLRLVSKGSVPDEARSPKAYLHRSAVNASIDILRRRRDTAQPEAADHLTTNEPHLDRERVRRAMAELDPEDAQLFVLCYLEGRTYEELAEMMSTERGTIASRLFRIRAELRERLTK